jgi:hypothetical protein
MHSGVRMSVDAGRPQLPSATAGPGTAHAAGGAAVAADQRPPAPGYAYYRTGVAAVGDGDPVMILLVVFGVAAAFRAVLRALRWGSVHIDIEPADTPPPSDKPGRQTD